MKKQLNEMAAKVYHHLDKEQQVGLVVLRPEGYSLRAISETDLMRQFNW